MYLYIYIYTQYMYIYIYIEHIFIYHVQSCTSDLYRYVFQVVKWNSRKHNAVSVAPFVAQ